MRRAPALLLALALAPLASACGRSGARDTLAGAGPPRHELDLRAGRLELALRDNARSPDLISGITRLVNDAEAPRANAFDDRVPRASTGWNLEHVTGGRATKHALFAPRSGTYALRALPGGRSAVLVRRAEDSPWRVASTTRFTIVAPHAVDIEFRCRFEDASLFDPQGWAMLFWANYMRPAPELAIHFPGVVATEPERSAPSEQAWIPAAAPNVHPRWANGGTYRALRAAPLEHDDDHPAGFVLWSYDVPRITHPLFYGRAPDGMALIVMFDRLWTEEDEIRFSLYSFKDDVPRPPARDVQYVVHRVEEGRDYGYRARLIWKRFVDEQDCLVEYERWLAALARVGAPAPGTHEVRADLSAARRPASR